MLPEQNHALEAAVQDKMSPYMPLANCPLDLHGFLYLQHRRDKLDHLSVFAEATPSAKNFNRMINIESLFRVTRRRGEQFA